MNKTELIKTLSKSTGLSIKESTGVLDAFTAIVMNELIKGNSVSVCSFGVFYPTECKARSSVNFQGERIMHAAHIRPMFRPSKLFKDTLNRPTLSPQSLIIGQ